MAPFAREILRPHEAKLQGALAICVLNHLWPLPNSIFCPAANLPKSCFRCFFFHLHLGSSLGIVLGSLWLLWAVILTCSILATLPQVSILPSLTWPPTLTSPGLLSGAWAAGEARPGDKPESPSHAEHTARRLMLRELVWGTVGLSSWQLNPWWSILLDAYEHLFLLPLSLFFKHQNHYTTGQGAGVRKAGQCA